MKKEVLNFEAPKLNYVEAARYLGVKARNEDDFLKDPELRKIRSLIHECYEEARPLLKYMVCYAELTKQEAGEFDFSGLEYCADCERIVVFGATIGLGIDRLINKYSSISVSKAAVFQALGAERIEALCDCFEQSIIGKGSLGGLTKNRISPGYGKFKLENQKEIFGILDLPKEIGLTLNESLLMSPSKSVTAIIGIQKGKTGSDFSDRDSISEGVDSAGGVTAHRSAASEKECSMSDHFANCGSTSKCVDCKMADCAYRDAK